MNPGQKAVASFQRKSRGPGSVEKNSQDNYKYVHFVRDLMNGICQRTNLYARNFCSVALAHTIPAHARVFGVCRNVCSGNALLYALRCLRCLRWQTMT